MWKVNKKIKVNIDGNTEIVKIIYDKKLKSKNQSFKRGYAPNFIVLRVPENTTDEEIEYRLNLPFYKQWLKGQKELYGDNKELYELEVKRLGFKLEERTLDELKEIVEKYICTTPISIVAVSVFKTAHLYNGESKILSKGLSKYSTMNLSRLSFDISNDSTLTLKLS